MSDYRCPDCGFYRDTPNHEMGCATGRSEIPAEHLARVNAGLYPMQNFWRVGRKVGRTIYAQIGSEPSDDDPLIGLMDTRALAEHAVSAHNAALTGNRS